MARILKHMLQNWNIPALLYYVATNINAIAFLGLLLKIVVSWVVCRDMERDRSWSPSPRKRRYSDDSRYDEEYSRREYYDDRSSDGRYGALS